MLYDYRCPTCDLLWEIKKSMLDDSPQHCWCCGTVMQRVYNSVPTVYYPGRYFGERDGWFWDTPFTGGTKVKKYF